MEQEQDAANIVQSAAAENREGEGADGADLSEDMSVESIGLELVAGGSSTDEEERGGEGVADEEEEEDATGDEEEDEEEEEEDEVSASLREALETLGLDCGELSAPVRERVLGTVGRDVSRAIDWIMENPEVVATWASLPQGGDADAPASTSTSIRLWSEVQTLDGKLGHVTAINADGTVDLELPGLPSRERIQASDLTVFSSGPPGSAAASNTAAAASSAGSASIAAGAPAGGGGIAPPGGGRGEPAPRVHDPAEDEDEEDDFGRLLGHLSEFTELAALSGGSGIAAESASNVTRSLAAMAAAHLSDVAFMDPQGPTSVGGIKVGAQVMLSQDSARYADTLRGPLRAGEVGEVVQLGGGHVSVRSVTTGRRWWYDAASLVEVPDSDNASPEDDVSALRECSRSNMASHMRAIRRILLKLRMRAPSTVASAPSAAALPAGEAGGGLQVLCDAGLIAALEDVLSRSEVCAGGGESALGVLQVLELLAAQLFTTAGAAGSKDCAPVGGMCEIGDWVTVKPGAGVAGGEGIVTDHLGMGDVCVAWAEGGGGGKPSRVPISALTRKANHGGGRGGVLGYLNELLISKAVPSGDANIVQRVLADGASIDHRDAAGNTPLILSAAKSPPATVEFVKVLLAHGASVHATNSAGRCALIECAERGHEELVKVLLAAGARPPATLEKDKVSSEAVWALIQEANSRLSEADSAGVGGDDGADGKRLLAVQESFIDKVLPAMATSPLFNGPLGIRLIIVLVDSIEKLQEPLIHRAAGGLHAWLHAGLSSVEALISSPARYEQLQCMRLVRALLRLDPAHVGFQLHRYGLPPILKGFKTVADGAQIRIIAPPPSAPLHNLSLVAHAAATSMPPPRVRGSVLAEQATPFGVSMLGEEVASLMPSSDACDGLTSEGEALRALAASVSAGDEDAAVQLIGMIAQGGKAVTASQLSTCGCIDALASFLTCPTASSALRVPSSSASLPQNPLLRSRARVLFTALGGASGAGCAALVRCCNVIIATREALPVYKHGVGGGGGGLSTLLEPHRVKLSYAQKTIEYSQEGGAQEGVEGGGNGDVDAGKKGEEGGECVPLSVLAEPIVTVSQLSNHVLRTSYVPHAGYQEYCAALVGSVVLERACRMEEERGEAGSCPRRRAVVVGYRLIPPLRVGVHSVEYKDEEGGCAELVLAVRDYVMTGEREEVAAVGEGEAQEGEKDTGEEDDEGGERVHSVVVTYPHEAVPMDLFVDSVMGSILQALRQKDPGQAPHGKNEGEEYDFPSRGFPDGQPEFQENLTRGLSQDPYTAAVARGQTRREAQVLLSRLDGLCEAKLEIDRSRPYMSSVPEGPSMPPGTRAMCKHNRQDWCSITVLSVDASSTRRGGSGPPSYTVVYDGGEVCSGVAKGSIKEANSHPRGGGRGGEGGGLSGLFGGLRVSGGAGAGAEVGYMNPAALSRGFASFLRKGQDAIPNRYDLTTGAGMPSSSPPPGASDHKGEQKQQEQQGARCGDVKGMSEGEGGDKGAIAPPVLELAFTMDTRSSTRPAGVATWHGVALSSQQRTIYEVSNDGATAKKAERDAYVDTLRCKEPVVSGAQRFRIRIDATSGEDFCNHIGFAAGEGYKGSALNSTDSCCIEVDSGRISVDGRSTGASITRPPAVGDVVVVEIDLDRGEFSGGIEGEGMTSVQWAPTKVPVFLAVSFRRLGWKVTVLGQPKAEISQEEIEEARKKEEAALASLCVLPPAMTVFQAMHMLVDGSSASSTASASNASQPTPAKRGGPGGQSLSASKRPYELLYEVRIRGQGTRKESAAATRLPSITPATAGVRSIGAIMREMQEQDDRSPSLLLADELQLPREEARCHISNPNLKPGCRLPFECASDCRRAAAEGMGRGKLVSKMQQVATDEWQRTMGMDGDANQLGEKSEWEVLHMLYRHLCGVPVTADVHNAIGGGGGGLPLAPQPFIGDQLESVGLDAEPKSAVKLLWLLVHLAPKHPPAGSSNPSPTGQETDGGDGGGVKEDGHIPLELLVNHRLDTRLLQQLDDALSIASGTLPAWCGALTSACPFLFELTSREKLVRCTAFGISHAMHWLQEEQVDESLRRRLRDAERAMAHVNEMTGDNAQRAYDRLMVVQEGIERQRIGGLKSDIARVQRGDDMLRQAEELMKIHAGVTRMLEVQFAGEHGFGWGVTQGFYTFIALELQRLGDPVPTWRPTNNGSDAVQLPSASSPSSAPARPGEGDVVSTGGGDSAASQYLDVGKEGLFIRPLHPRSQQLPVACNRFRFLGRLMAKAFRDGFTVPLPLSPAFFSLLRGDSLTARDLPKGGLAGCIVRLLEVLESAGGDGSSVAAMPCTVMVPEYSGPFLSIQEYLESAYGEMPSFVDPEGLVVSPDDSEPAELCPGGSRRRLVVEEGCVRDYVSHLVDLWLSLGVQMQMEAFREGIQEVFGVPSLLRFSPLELQRLFCGHQKVVWTAYITNDWLAGTVQEEEEVRALTEHITPVGRLTKDSPLFLLLISELAHMQNEKRSAFLDFVTATPRLPPGGLPQAGIKVATRAGKIVWSQTCIRTLYLPEGVETADELRDALDEAFANAALGGFHEQNLAGATS